MRTSAGPNIGVKVAVLLIGATAAAAGPATRLDAATRRTDMARWLAMLGDPESTRREEARIALMGLSSDDLPALSDLARSLRPLRPGQGEPLREIVTYVRVRAAIERLPTESTAMLGVMWVPRDQDPANDDPTGPKSGVTIDHCLPGMVGFRYLRAGDVIVASGDDDPMPPINNLRDVVGERTAGAAVRFLVRRAGVLVKVRLTLDRKPSLLLTPTGQMALDDVVETAEKEAAAYYDREFAPLVGESGA